MNAALGRRKGYDMKTIAIMNNKGGVGKTVTAVNLADILVREHHKRVILADCDGQMNASRIIAPDLPRRFTALDGYVTLRDILTGNGEPYWRDNLLEVRDWEGLSLLPATPDLYALDVDTVTAAPSRALRLGALRDFRNAVESDGETDFLLFDCPPGFTSSSCAALLAAEEVIIPVVIDGFSISGMVDMSTQITSMSRANAGIRIAGALITQWHNADVVLQGECMLRRMDVPVFDTVIRRTDKVAESTIDGKPIWRYSPGSAASQDYRKFVREFLGEV